MQIALALIGVGLLAFVGLVYLFRQGLETSDEQKRNERRVRENPDLYKYLGMVPEDREHWVPSQYAHYLWEDRDTGEVLVCRGFYEGTPWEECPEGFASNHQPSF